MPDPSPQPHAQHHESIKDTLISIVIAFALAFVFRGFVVEAFVIPTGSMAPTLMGAHMRFQADESGYQWPVGPWEASAPNSSNYLSIQGADRVVSRANPKSGQIEPERVERPVIVHDPMTGQPIERKAVRLRSGDRILVLKYLYSIVDPQRYDVIVFKNPTDPQENFIKRLIGLPGEEIALVDGDVYVRATGPSGPAAPASVGAGSWAHPGWHIERKPELQQRAVWQAVFDSSCAPLDAQPWFTSPWVGRGGGAWDIKDKRSYTYAGPARTDLVFDQTRTHLGWGGEPIDTRGGGSGGAGKRREPWAVDDRYPYDETPLPNPQGQRRRFPVSDVRLRAGLEPAAAGLIVEATIEARGRQFQARIDGPTMSLRVREPMTTSGELSDWKVVETATTTPLEPGRVTNVEFWHADQRLSVYVDGERVGNGWEYDGTPADRIQAATGRTLDDLLAADGSTALANARIYSTPQIRWSFEGAGVKLHRVGLDRDLFYQPDVDHSGRAARATSPASPLVLSTDQFFACGDNSPASSDGRLWSNVDPWVQYELDDTVGIVPRDLLMGRAFFVYWPSLLYERGPLPMPDFGRMRFIW